MAGRLICTLLLMVLPGLGSDSPPAEAAKRERLSALISRYGAYGYLNGAVLVADHGKVIFESGVGQANIETHATNTSRTKFAIASLTKQFTAALVLEEASAGRIQLDGSVRQYLPWYRTETGAKMTIEELLRHTSGLPADFDSPEFNATAEARVAYRPQAFAEKFCEPELAYQPGSQWAYSNCGYILLGLVLERETGKSFAELLRSRLLDPLGMGDTGMDSYGPPGADHALGYERHFGPSYRVGPYIDREHIFSAGAMYSTVEDLFRWNQALSSGDLLPASVLQKIFQPGRNDWAYGWFVSRIPQGQPGAGELKATMAGDMPGNFFATITRFPQRGSVIIVLRNGYGSPERLEANIQAILFDAPSRLPWRNPADIIVRLAGGILERWLLILLVIGAVVFYRATRRRAARSTAGRFLS